MTTRRGILRCNRLQFGTSFLRYGDMTEDGAESQNAVIHGGSETHLWVEPAIGGRYVVNFGSGGRCARSRASACCSTCRAPAPRCAPGSKARRWRQRRCASAPISIARTWWVRPGLQYRRSDGFTLGLSYTHQESDIREGGAGSLRFVLPLQ